MIERRHHESLHELATAFADFAASILRDALRQNNTASLVVPGGETPAYYLPVLAHQVLPWQNIYITLSDERWVETEEEASNERLVRDCFLEHMPEKAHFIGLKTPHSHASEAIIMVHERLSRLPRPFTLTILGLGEDGHIASLFPGLTMNHNTPYLCQAVDPPIALSPRISLTLPALVDSHHIALVIKGITKRQLLERLIRNPDPRIPFVQLMQQSQSPITIFETD